MSDLSGVIDNLDRFKQVLDGWRGKAHILSPLARMDFNYVCPGFSPSIRVAYISTDEGSREIYEMWDKKGTYCLSKLGLQRLDAIAGLRWVQAKSERNKENPLICTAVCECEIQDVDGTIRNSLATKTVDLTDGAPETRGMTPKQLIRARGNLNSLCETKCKNKCRREILGLNDGFALNDFKKPFVIIRLVPTQQQKIDDPVLELAVKLSQHNVSMELYVEAQKFLQNKEPDLQAPSFNIMTDTIGPGLLPEPEPQTLSELMKTKPIDPHEVLLSVVEDLYVKEGMVRSAKKVPLKDLK